MARIAVADAFVISHTKSGRTWLRAMVSHVYHRRYGLPPDELLIFDNLQALDRRVPRIFFCRDLDIPVYLLRQRRAVLPLDRPTLFLVRDPRDVAVSFRLHLQSRAGKVELYRKAIAPTKLTLDPFAFAMDLEVGVPRIIEHYNRWHATMARMPHPKLVTYEDLRADPTGQLDGVMRHFGLEPTPDELAAAVRFGSFGSLAEKERSGFFQSERLRPSGKGEAPGFKVRRGVVAGYRQDFSAEQLAVLDRLVADSLHPAFGYGRRTDVGGTPGQPIGDELAIS